MSGWVNKDDVGKYFLGPDDQIWQMVGFCELPTATMENVKTGEQRGGAVGCPNLQQFTRLIKENEKPS